MSDEAVALDAHSAADAFSSLLGSDDPNENEPLTEVETDEQKAGKLAVSEIEAEDEVTELDPDEGSLTIEVDGKQVVITKEQAAENYKNGLRQADYTRKTMEAAEARKTADAEKSQARQERENYSQRLEHFSIATNSQMQQLAEQLTDELFENDPMGYFRIERTLKDGQAKLVEAQKALEQIGEQRKHEQADDNRSFLENQRDALVDKLPELKAPAKLQEFMQKLDPFLIEQGFTKDDGRMLLDARFLMMAHKATQYDALMTRAKTAVVKVAALPTKVERAGSPEVRSPDKRTTAMKQLERTGGSIDAAANAFAQFL